MLLSPQVATIEFAERQWAVRCRGDLCRLTGNDGAATIASQLRRVNVALTNEQLQTIGRVCAQWSVAQSVLEHVLWSILGIARSIGLRITTHMPDDARRNAI